VKFFVETVEPTGLSQDEDYTGMRALAYQSVAAPSNASFSIGTSLGTNLLTG
jgi:hypothetical protein